MPDGTQPTDIESSNLIRRWGNDESVFSDGFVAVPTLLLRNMSSLGDDGITPSEAIFILQIMSFKWGPEDPYPSYKRIADCMDISEAYARKIARSLDEKNLLARRRREGTTNKFDLSPLFEQLAEIGEELESPLPF